ncbi:MAG: HAMP domain-containing protein [Rickettsiales bacterium]|nr:HAMP domain-containing protein [Rickettsiales bacterium]
MTGGHFSIKRKLTLMMMGVSLMAVLLTVLAITSYQIYDMRASRMQELDITAAVTGDRNAAALTFLDADRAHANLEIFRLNPSIMAACIYDAAGKLFASYSAPGGACPQGVEESKKPLAGMFTTFQPIRQHEQVVGSTYLVANTKDIGAYVRKIIQISLTSALGVMVMALGMTVYFRRVISGPILELAETARTITQKRDFTLSAPVRNKDETGYLAAAFNDMLAEVRNSKQELLYANETLEHKVLLRTRQLEEAKRQAEEANEAKSEFLRNISHEFRTPLHAMISFSSYGIKEIESGDRNEFKRYFQIIMNSSERLSRLVNEVLDIARFEHGEQVYSMRKTDMSELISRATDTVRSLAEEKKVTFAYEQLADDMVITCDQDRIMQVITNLLGNAIKFTPPKSRILIRYGVLTQEGENSVFASFIDEGVGVPECEKDMIFEPFRQSSHTKTGAGGTGLGLAICRGIIRAHGGQIWAENNEEGRGANFTFTIPRKLPEGRRAIHTLPQLTEDHHENAA